MTDVAVIGAGVAGCAAARELSRYRLSVVVFEKNEDVGAGTSKANSAIVHAGYDAEPGTLMAKLNVEGNRMMGDLAEELDFPFKRIGSLVVCTKQEERVKLEELYNRGVTNGVGGLRILGREELVSMEPNISDEACAALFAPSGGIVCPFLLTIAMAENAAANGVEFRLNTEVKSIRKTAEGFEITTDQGVEQCRYIVNAAGVHADEIHNMVSRHPLHITPRRGEYFLLDKSAGSHVFHTIFMLPGKMGKGVLVTPTVHGNLLVGPNAEDLEDKDAVNTTAAGLETVRKMASKTVKDIPFGEVITSFAGLRAAEDGGDFVIKEADDVPGFIDCAGIKSPGLSAAPAIGRMVADLVADLLKPERKDDFISRRTGFTNPRALSKEERAELIRKNPEFGNIICRCEMVSEGEILEAIHRPLGARSLDGVKRRVRAGMGRCQSGFCSPRVMEILAREVPGITMENVTKCGGRSRLTVGVR